jgi:hypothetical protein
MSGDQNAGRSYIIKIDNGSFEKVEEFRYLGTTLTYHNSGERKPTNAQGCCNQFLLCWLNYPDMFRHPNAIFGGLLVPCKLLQF